MAKLIILNKPFNVLCQFTDKENRQTLADFISVPDVYPAGRLDYDSEGLLALTDDGQLQARIAEPRQKMPKTYLVQVEGTPSSASLKQLQRGVQLKDGKTLPCKVQILTPPNIWERHPPVRQRNNDELSWLEITISEGRNRQVRRMTAHIGHPTLRLIRTAIGPWKLEGLQPGDSRQEDVHLPSEQQRSHSKSGQNRSGRRSRI